MAAPLRASAPPSLFPTGSASVAPPAYTAPAPTGDAALAYPSAPPAGSAALAYPPPLPSYDDAVYVDPTPGPASDWFSPQEVQQLVDAQGVVAVPYQGAPAPGPFAPSEAAIIESSHRVVSLDERLCTTEELMRYFKTHNEPPEVALGISGTHTETRTRTVSYTDSEGRHRTRRETYTVTITDFSYVAPLSFALCPFGCESLSPGSALVRVPTHPRQCRHSGGPRGA